MVKEANVKSLLILCSVKGTTVVDFTFLFWINETKGPQRFFEDLCTYIAYYYDLLLLK